MSNLYTIWEIVWCSFRWPPEKAYVYHVFDDEMPCVCLLAQRDMEDLWGFSPKEQQQYITGTGMSSTLKYQFMNVMKLQRDIDDSLFNKIFIS